MHARFAVTFERGEPRRRLVERSRKLGFEVAADRTVALVLADSRTKVAVAEKGILIGQLFAPDGRPLDDPDGGDGDAGPARGSWGNFALFNEQPPSVYRDPSGSIPLYQVEARDCSVFLSDADLAAGLGLLDDARLDPDFAVHWLQFPYLRSSRTGIATAVEILPGTRRTARGGSWVDEPNWTPWTSCRPTASALQPAEAAQRLRQVALQTIAPQMSGSRPFLQLSGGLDSSIVAACLAHHGIDFTAVNFVTRSADGDERRYARTVTGKYGAALVEIHERDLDWSLRQAEELRFRPGSNPVLEPLDRAIERRRHDLGLEMLVDGGGGDNLFAFLTSAAPVVDALLGAGPRAAWRTIGDIAARAECSSWTVAGHAACRALALKPPSWREDRRLLTRDCLLACPDRHPWLDSPRFARPAKRDHVVGLVEIQHFLDRRVGARQAVLHPLMAQPLLELCLSIPAWHWVRGGIDRAIARMAFEELVPAPILERRTKGSLQGLVHRSFKRLRTELQDLLLGGELRSLRIVDAAAVERAFAGDSATEGETQMRLTEMAALELWLRSWTGHHPHRHGTGGTDR